MTDRERTFTTPYALDVPALLSTPENPDGSLLVALHGLGMTPESFRDEVSACAPAATTLLIPQGPLPFEMRRPSGIRQGNAWYIYTGDNPEFRAWLPRTEEWLLRVVDHALEHDDIDPGRVDLLGFSQGGYLAGFAGVRNPDSFRRLVVAGGRIKHEILAEPAATAVRDHPEFRVLCVHGDSDESISGDAVRRSADALRAQGLEVSFEAFPAGHRVLREPGCQAAIRRFLSG